MKKRKNSSLVPWAVDSRSLIKWVQRGMPAKYKNRKMNLICMIPDKINEEVRCGENVVALIDYSTKPPTVCVTHMDNIDLLI